MNAKLRDQDETNGPYSSSNNDSGNDVSGEMHASDNPGKRHDGARREGERTPI